MNLDNILVHKDRAHRRNDNTITHKKKLYQIEEPVKAGKVIIEQHINGKMRLTYDGKSLKFKEIEVRPETAKTKDKAQEKGNPVYHQQQQPWKKFNIRGIYETVRATEKWWDGGSSLKTGHFYFPITFFLDKANTFYLTKKTC